jgi:DNA-binding transcriptional regulator YiaG
MSKKRQKAPRASDMTAADVKKIRAKLGLTPAQLAEQVGVHVVTVRKWETGLQKVGAAHAKLLRLMVTMQK